MLIGENMIRNFIATEEWRNKEDSRDAVTILAIAANTYAQLSINANDGRITPFMKKRVLDSVKLISNLILQEKVLVLNTELIQMLKNIVRTLGLTKKLRNIIPIDCGEEFLPEYTEDVVNKCFTPDEITYLICSMETDYLAYRRMRARLDCYVCRAIAANIGLDDQHDRQLRNNCI